MFLTTMHERYAFGALVFLALLIADVNIRLPWLVFGAAFTLNLLAAVPPTPEIERLLPVGGVLGVVGSLVMLAITIAVLHALLRERPPPPT